MLDIQLLRKDAALVAERLAVQVIDVPEWTYMKVVKGEIVERRSLRKTEQSRVIPSMPMRDREYVNPHMFNVSHHKAMSLRDRMDLAYGFKR